MRPRAPLAPALLLAAAASTAACSSEPQPAPAPTARATVAPGPPASPVDHVDPHELPEGAEKAFGFPVPRPMKVEERFPDAIRAEGAVPMADLANYVRSRVIADRVETGPAKTVFHNATLKSAPDHLLRVEVVGFGSSSELLVRDVTRPASTSVVAPTDPWYKPGFDPKDRKADPKRNE